MARISEMKSAAKLWSGNLGCHVIKFPSGKFGFVGSVPASIYYVDGATEKEISDARQFGERFGPKRRVFETEQEARDFATLHGVTLKD